MLILKCDRSGSQLLLFWFWFFPFIFWIWIGSIQKQEKVGTFTLHFTRNSHYAQFLEFFIFFYFVQWSLPFTFSLPFSFLFLKHKNWKNFIRINWAKKQNRLTGSTEYCGVTWQLINFEIVINANEEREEAKEKKHSMQESKRGNNIIFAGAATVNFD